jgi:hypothetical protein
VRRYCWDASPGATKQRLSGSDDDRVSSVGVPTLTEGQVAATNEELLPQSRTSSSPADINIVQRSVEQSPVDLLGTRVQSTYLSPDAPADVQGFGGSAGPAGSYDLAGSEGSAP